MQEMNKSELGLDPQRPASGPAPSSPPQTPSAGGADFAIALKACQRERDLLGEGLAAARQEIARLRKSVLNQCGDNLCFLTEDDLKAIEQDRGKIPPDFEESCRRFREQVSGERGVLSGCKTIAQLEAECGEWREVMRMLSDVFGGGPEAAVRLLDQARRQEREMEVLRAALERCRQGYLNILEFRKLDGARWGERDGYGGRYGALAREEVEKVIAEIDEALECDSKDGGKDA